MLRLGIILVVFGILYLIKPDIYRKGIWRKTDILQRKLSPERYKQFMRWLGGVFLVAGSILILLSQV
jgi:uncharacterized protein YjeT (DUF2065 family)